MSNSPEQIIPEQHSGVATDTESEIALVNEEEAKAFFEVAKERLLDVTNWQSLAGKTTAAFQLTDEKGQLVNRKAKTGDYLRIDVPGPGSQSGDGYDWVQIEVMDNEHKHNTDCQVIRVRPASNPTNNKDDIAHFFSEEATSTFVVKREGNKVIASVHGRNEKPNFESETVLDKIRHTAVATGAVSGFSKIQWKSLVNGIVKRE